MLHRKQIIITLVILAGLAACQFRSTPTPEPTEPAPANIQTEATATPAEVAEAPAPPMPAGPFPPLVLQTEPASGAEIPLDGTLAIHFDQPMDQDSVEAAFSIQPAINGNLRWQNESLLHFEPAADYERGQRYKISVLADAKSVDGLPLNRDFELSFNTPGPLEVTSVQPEQEAIDIESDNIVTVLFNRPVVPLSAIEDLGRLPDPLTFVPPVTGHGEWLNTSIYQFTPDEGFEPATEYTARIAAGLKDVSGTALEDDYTWTFSTAAPRAVASTPDQGAIYVSTRPEISVAFNQTMNRESVEEAFSLIDPETGDALPGSFTWAAEGLVQPIDPYSDEFFYAEPFDEGNGPEAVGVETMTFTPDELLQPEVTYFVIIAETAKGSHGNQANLASEMRLAFTVVPDLAVVNTFPVDGTRARYYENLQITFSAPVNQESLEFGRNVLITPSIEVTRVYSYFYDSNTVLNISLPTNPSSAYTVTLLGDGLESRYGQTLGEDVTINWETGALEPLLYLHIPSFNQVSTYSAFTETMAYITVRNTRAVDFALYQLPENDFLSLNGDDRWQFSQGYQPDPDDLIRAWQIETAPDLNEGLIYGTNLAGERGSILSPGLYYLIVDIPSESIYPEARYAGGVERIKQAIVVSNYNLTVKTASDEMLAWLTDLQTSEPIAGANVRFLTESGLLAEGTTDEMGVTHVEHDQRDPWQARLVISDDPFAVAMNQWNMGVERWQYGISTEDFLRPVNGYFYTDRAIYRPGQTVYFKGVMREDDDAHYSLLPEDTPINIKIYDAQGKEVFADQYVLSEAGTLYGELALDEEAALGYYNIEAKYQDEFFNHSFQVAEFRRPEFIIDVITDEPEYVQGDTIELTADASFFFGGSVANADVTYNILSADYFFIYSGPGRYDFTDYDYARSQGQFFGSFGELIEEGTGSTDSQGRFTLELSADIADRVASQRFTLEVTVTDPDSNQIVAGRTSAVVHKGDFYIGLQPRQYVSSAGDETLVDVITVDQDSQPVANQEVTVVFAERNWFSVQVQGEDGRYYWTSEVETNPVFTTTIETDSEGKGVAAFTPANGGNFQVEALSTDGDGNTIRSSTYMWVSGNTFVNWRQENNDRLELVTDKREYEVGDIATILIPHPYSGTVQALITQERGRIYDYETTTLATNSEQIEVPITEAMLPNMFISVVVLQEPSGENPLASFKVGYAQLPINVKEKEIDITLTPDKPLDENYRPGESITYDIQATDSDGNPVAAEFSLALVDKAILTLADESGLSILEQFWRERGLGVDTAATLAISAERVNLAIAPEAKGGGGGGFDEGFGVIRGEFKDTAFWVADFTTDESGQGSVTTTLPDNLTTWVMTARGVTPDTLVGDEQIEIVSTKPLLVRPVAPRFFVVGDEAELSMVIQNNTDEDLAVSALFEGVGVELINGSADADMTIEAGDNATVTYPVKVLDGNSNVVTLRFGAKSDTVADAVEIDLPVHRHSTPQTVGTAGVIETDGQQLEGIALPVSFDPTQGELTVNINPSLAAGMRAGLDYLEHFPYECTEQTVSRFLPNIVTYRAYQALNIDNPELERRLPGLVSLGLQRLYNQQHLDGGWGWWSNDSSNPFLSAYVIQGMVEAERAGFAVDQTVMEEGISFLKRSLNSLQDTALPWQANRQAFILYVLAEAGEGDMGRTVSLYDRREKLDIYGRAYLALTFALLEADDPRIDTILSEINSQAIVSATGAHWEEDQPDYWNMNTDTRSTAIIVTALSRLDPGNALAPNAVRWLMSVRENDRWESTQETAWAVIGLTDWMIATGELQANYDWAVSLNATAVGDGAVDAANLDETTTLSVEVAQLLTDEVNRLVIERSPQNSDNVSLGRLYYTAHLESFKPVEEVKALERGVVVARRYSLATDDPDEGVPQAISGAKVGDIINVSLTVVAPNDLHYVIVEDPIPGGTEAIDVSLKTTSVVGEQPQIDRQRGDGWGWWWFSHTELRDEKAVLFASYLPKGTYEYTYQIRASLPGEYRVLPSRAEEMYFPEVFGHGDGGVFTITD